MKMRSCSRLPRAERLVADVAGTQMKSNMPPTAETAALAVAVINMAESNGGVVGGLSSLSFNVLIGGPSTGVGEGQIDVVAPATLSGAYRCVPCR